MVYAIPFNRPCLMGNEQKYMAEAVAGGHISGDGPFTRRCHAFLEKECNAIKALLTTSCTHALEMAAILLDIHAGDEVIVPSFTFVSTVNAFVLRGARPVFCDIRPDTLNMDETLLERLITPKTRAIIPVHYAGVACEMNAILALAARYGIAVVEDNAHGLLGRYHNRPLGSFGCLATQSFHETKNFICGEGGALLINDHRLIERAEIIREKGTNRNQVFRGLVDKYSWMDIGSSYLPSDILAAFLWAQFEAREHIQNARRKIWNCYAHNLAAWSKANGVATPQTPPYCEQPFHMFYLLMPSPAARSALIEQLKTKSILSVFHYLPLHLSKMGGRFGGKQGDCPITEDVSERLVRLPFYTSLSADEQARVVEAVLAVNI